MCGRLVIFSPVSHFSDYLRLEQLYNFDPAYNIPPGATIPICRRGAGNTNELLPARWGLVPRWSQGPDNRFSMFNARAETVHEKPAFRTAFKKQRCLVPVDGFYEWRQENGKQPYYFYRPTGNPLAFAGLWEQWHDPRGTTVDSCTIIVTSANSLMRPVHDRMPVVLDPDQFAGWLDPDNQATADLLRYLQPYEGGDLDCYPVSRAVNNPRNTTAELIEKI